MQDPFGGIVSPVTRAWPLVAGNALKATLPPHVVVPFESVYGLPELVLTTNAPPVNWVGVGLVTVKLWVVVCVVSTLVSGEPATVSGKAMICSVCEADVWFDP